MYSKQLVLPSLLLAFSFDFVQSQADLSSQTFFPAAVPLAVRSPYFSAWLATLNGTQPTNTWPSFWSDNANVVGWAGHIRVDGVTYKWLGNFPGPNGTTLTDLQITPTRSIFSIQAGPLDLTVTFFTPIEPSDWVRQSMPFSYLSLEATSNDGQAHDVQVYSDISGEWSSGDRTNDITWSTTQTASSVFHQIQLTTPSAFTEISEQAEDGVLYHAMSVQPGLSWQTASDDTCRGNFAQSGVLPNTQDFNFRPINSNFPVFALAVDLGTIAATQTPVTWAVGFTRNPSIRYTTQTGRDQLRSPLYVSQYNSPQDAVEAFLADFSDAQTRANTLDNTTLQNALAVSAEYANLVSLTARQVFGGLDITVSNGSDGHWNTSDVKIFVKDLGNSGRVNPVEQLYSSLPTFLYFNASFVGPLLSPLLEFQDSGQYGQPYATQDLGSSYPTAAGSNVTHDRGVEQTGNMLIMALAHARTSGDGSLLKQHYALFKGWADYLVSNSLIPTNQLAADLQENANLTNLAIKGIIGVKAMSDISTALGMSEDATQYSTEASTLLGEWKGLALTSNTTDHSQAIISSSYGEQSSWALEYNLYADRLLNTSVVDESIYQDQTNEYQNLASSAPPFGLPIDSDAPQQGNSAWTLFTAATTTDPSVRDALIHMAWTHASSNFSAGVFPTRYDVDTGVPIGGGASPAQGGMFAPLALNVAVSTAIAIPQSDASKSKSNVGAIVGGLIGGLAAAAFIILGIVVVYRKTRKPGPEEEAVVEVHRIPPPEPYVWTPPSRSRTIRDGSNDVVVETLISMKEREHRYGPRRFNAEESSVSRSLSVGTMIRSEAGSSRTAGSDGDILSTTEVVELRTEVQELRRVMQEIQAVRVEPPPSYAD